MTPSKQILVKAKNKEDMISQYISLFETYHLTVYETADILGCGEQYVRLNKEKISHIRINTVARDKFFELYNEGISYSDSIVRLFMKRVLFSREGVDQFIKENAKLEILYCRVNLAEHNINSSVSVKKARSVINSFYRKELKPIYEEITKVPAKLCSMKEIMSELGYNYDIEVRRDIEHLGVNKIKLANLIRYDIEDFFIGHDEVVVPYHLWQANPSKVIKEISRLLQ